MLCVSWLYLDPVYWLTVIGLIVIVGLIAAGVARRIIVDAMKRLGAFLYHVWRFSVSVYFAFTPFPRFGRWIAHHISVFIAILTAFFALASAFSVWHYASAATHDRANVVTNGLAGIGTLLAAGIALYVALLAQERAEIKEHQRIRPILSVYVIWSPPSKQSGHLTVFIENEWGDPGYGFFVFLRPSHLPQEASFHMDSQTQNATLLSRGKAWQFSSSRTGFADETGYFIYVRYTDILGWEWHTEDGVWLSKVGNTMRMGLGQNAMPITPHRRALVPMPIPQRVTKDLPLMWGPEAFHLLRSPSIRRQIANLWFNSRPRSPRVTVSPPNYSPTSYTPLGYVRSPPMRGRSTYWLPRSASRYRRRS